MKESPKEAYAYKLCNCCMHHFKDLNDEDLCRQCDTYAQKKYQEGELNGRIDEVKNLGGQTMHKADAGGWCRKSGEQFKECLQCLKDERLSQLERKEQ